MERFFSSQHPLSKFSKRELNRTSNYMDAIYAFARITDKSLYIIDYKTNSFEYVSENPLFLCGLHAEQVREMGYGFYIKNISETEIDFLIKANKIWFDFLDKIPIDEKKFYTLSYEFHLKCDKGKGILVNQKLTPLVLTGCGKIWKALCIVSLSTEKNAGNVKIFKKGDTKVLHFDLLSKQWQANEKISLSDREREILHLSIRGFTIVEIANEIFVSPETVKFHRRKLFEKMKVPNISGAIAYAINYKLI